MGAPGAVIRAYIPSDRPAVRRISYETSFLGRPEVFQIDPETVADVLTAYYTDLEPESTFVACVDGEVVGYLTGTLDAVRMNRRMAWREIPVLAARALVRGAFFRRSSWRLLGRFLRSWRRGEFHTSDFLRDYPAGLHINLSEGARGSGLGAGLIQQFCAYASGRGVKGVHCGTMSEEARAFFEKQGFQVIWQGRRSYLDDVLNGQYVYYVLGRSA